MLIKLSKIHTISDSFKKKKIKELLGLDEELVYELAEIPHLPIAGECMIFWEVNRDSAKKSDAYRTTKIQLVIPFNELPRRDQPSYLVKTRNSTYKIRLVEE
jgi:hypothetical protein